MRPCSHAMRLIYKWSRRNFLDRDKSAICREGRRDFAAAREKAASHLQICGASVDSATEYLDASRRLKTLRHSCRLCGDLFRSRCDSAAFAAPWRGGRV